MTIPKASYWNINDELQEVVAWPNRPNRESATQFLRRLYIMGQNHRFNHDLICRIRTIAEAVYERCLFKRELAELGTFFSCESRRLDRWIHQVKKEADNIKKLVSIREDWEQRPKVRRF